MKQKRSIEMAVEYRNECCDCAVPAYPCLGDICPNRHVKYLVCDNCGEDTDELWNGLCEECFIEDAKNNADHEKLD